MDFQVNDQTYFVNVGDAGWEVMVSTPNGPQSIPVYRDTHDARPWSCYKTMATGCRINC
jgi:hypothetical protein